MKAEDVKKLVDSAGSLSPTETETLKSLRDEDGPLSTTQLAAKLTLLPVEVSVSLTRLKEEGLVVAEGSVTEAGSSTDIEDEYVSLTETGGAAANLVDLVG